MDRTATVRRRTAVIATAALAVLAAAVWATELITSGPRTEGGHDRGGVVRQLLTGPGTQTQAHVEHVHDLLNAAVWGDPTLADVQPEACRVTRRAVDTAQREADELPDGTDEDLLAVARLVCDEVGGVGARTRHDAVERVELRIAGS
jgi:hypothetical protein